MASQDHSVGQGDDRAYLRNVAFVPKAKAAAPKAAAPKAEAPKAAASVEDARARRRAHRARSVLKIQMLKRSKSWEKRSEGDAVKERESAHNSCFCVRLVSCRTGSSSVASTRPFKRPALPSPLTF